MNRKGVEALPVPVRLASLMPAIYHEHDPNMLLLTEIVDELLAPVWLVLDNLDAYLDPRLAPTDFVEVLASWLGLELDAHWSWDRRRAAVANAVEAFRWEGTRRAVVHEVETYCGLTPFVADSGGVSWSATPGGAPPGSPTPAVRVQLDVPDDRDIDQVRLERLIARRVPAHVPVTVELRRSS